MLPDFVGDQTPTIFDDATSAAFFFHRIKGTKGIEVKQIRVPLYNAKKYKTIDDVLSDVTLIPIERRAYEIKDLRMHVARDALVTLGTVFEEYGIVAHAGFGPSPMDKPIAFINDPKGAYYIGHPYCKDYVKRIVPKDPEEFIRRTVAP